MVWPTWRRKGETEVVTKDPGGMKMLPYNPGPIMNLPTTEGAPKPPPPPLQPPLEPLPPVAPSLLLATADDVPQLAWGLPPASLPLQPGPKVTEEAIERYKRGTLQFRIDADMEAAAARAAAWYQREQAYCFATGAEVREPELLEAAELVMGRWEARKREIEAERRRERAVTMPAVLALAGVRVPGGDSDDDSDGWSEDGEEYVRQGKKLSEKRGKGRIDELMAAALAFERGMKKATFAAEAAKERPLVVDPSWREAVLQAARTRKRQGAAPALRYGAFTTQRRAGPPAATGGGCASNI